MAAGDDCGAYPAASNYADTYVDGNGATIYSPLTPAQSAAYLAAVAAFQQCQSAAQGVPLCPVGEYFAGNLTDGTWYGHCVSDYTGQPTTPDVFIADTPSSPGAPLTVPTTSPAPVTSQPMTTPPVVTSPPVTTPTTPKGLPESTGTPKLQAHDLFVPGGEPDIGAYCDVYPDDPYCVYYSALQNAGVPPPGGSVTNVTTIQYNAGLLATDVHAIVNDALAGLWGAVVTSVDIAFGGLFSGLQNALTAIGNAVKAAWNILSRLSGLILQFLGQMWFRVIHGLVLAVQDLSSWLKDVYDNVLKPMMGMLQRIRQTILDLWKRFVVPLLIIIQDIRRVLAILSLFHVKFAAKLDQKLGQLEAKITQPLLVVLGAVNQVANWINLISTAGYLLQKPIFLSSLKAYVGSSLNLQINAMTKPIGASELAAFQQSAVLPTAAQSSSAAVDYLQTGSGINATIADQQRAALQGYLANGF